MTREQFEGIVRHAVTLLGAVILVFFSEAEGLVGEISGSLVMLSGVIWSLVRKTGQPLIDKIKGVVNHAVAITGAFLLYFGHDETWSTLESVIGTLMNLLPFILSFADKSKK